MNVVVTSYACCSIADKAVSILTAIRYKRNQQTTAGHGFSVVYAHRIYEQRQVRFCDQ